MNIKMVILAILVVITFCVVGNVTASHVWLPYGDLFVLPMIPSWTDMTSSYEMGTIWDGGDR